VVITRITFVLVHTPNTRITFVRHICKEDRARELMPIIASFTQKSVMHFSSRRADFPYTRLLRFSLFTELFAAVAGNTLIQFSLHFIR